MKNKKQNLHKTVAGALAALLLCLLASCSINGTPTIEVDRGMSPNSGYTDNRSGSSVYPSGGVTGRVQDTSDRITNPTEESAPPQTDRNGQTLAPATHNSNTSQPQQQQSGNKTTTGDTQQQQTQPRNEEKTLLPLPVSVAEIIRFYNDATQKVNSQRPSMRKYMNTTVEYIDGIEPLESIPVPGVNPRKEIGLRLGEGEVNKNIPRGSTDGALMLSTLTQDDVTGAVCTQSGSVYTVTLSVEDAENPEHNRNTPISRFTNDFVPGSKAKHDIENLTVMGIKINATVASVTLNTKNVKIVAKIDAYTGRPVSVSHTFGFNVLMKDVKGSALGIKKEMPEIKGAGHTQVDFSSFFFV